MITRSAVKKSSANKCEVEKPLSSVTKKKIKSTVKGKISIQTPLKALNDVHNNETNLENVQSPVFNIHVHMPTTVTGNLNKSSQFQPVIHLHFGGLINGLSSGSDATSEDSEIINKASKVELSSEVNCNSEEQSNSHENMFSKPLKNNKTCRKLSFSRSNGISEGFKIEKVKAVVKSIGEIEGSEEFARNSLCKRQFPVRRSVRQENNRKLLKILKDISENKSTATEIEKKKLRRNIRTASKSGSLKETLNLKEPVVVLHDIMKVMEKKNITLYNNIMGDKQEDSCSPIHTSACNDPEKVENSSCDLLSESVNEQNSEGNEENEESLKKDLDDQNVISVCKKFGEVYSLVYSSDNETNSANDFADKHTFSEDLGVNFKNEVAPEKDFYENPLDNCIKDTENQVNISVPLHPVQENGLSNLLSNGKDSLLNLKHSDVNDKTVSLNSKLKDSGSSNDSSSDNSDSELFQTSNFEEDNHEIDSSKVLDMERVNSESKQDDLVKNVIGENKLSSTEANGYKEINVKTLNFQIDLIKKEMKKRGIIKADLSRKKKKTESQAKLKISEEVPEKSLMAKKVKLSEELTRDKPVPKNVEKTSSAVDYIPLKVSGPTKFAVAQLSKVKPYSGHKAKNFRNEMLFSNRVKRYSDPKHCEIYRLKKIAAEKRNK